MNRDTALLGAAALIFTVSAAVTIAWSASMSDMGEMPMPGGWGMSMAWMRMPGQTWTEAFTAFIGMWTVMMVAMMLPSLVATLRHRRYAPAGASAIASVAYFAVWTAIGVAAYPSGVALAELEMRAPAIAEIVAMRRVAARPRATTRSSRPAIAVGGGFAPRDTALLERLKAWRLAEARTQSVPAFVILHDKTLAEIARQRPHTLTALGSVSGIGAKKLERYGPALVALVGEV